MVEHQCIGCRIPYIDNAIFQSSKLKLRVSRLILLSETVNALQMIPGLQLPGQANMVQMPNIMMQNMMPNMQPGMQQMRPGMVQPGQPIFPGQPG